MCGKRLLFHVAAFECLQLGKHAVRHLHKVTVLFSVDNTKSMHVRVLAQVFQLRLLVVGVDGNGYRTNLGTGIKERQPVGDVSCPYSYMGTVRNADGKQSLRHIVYTAVELTPRKAQVTVGVYDVFLVGRFGSPVFQPVAQGSFR